MLKPDAVIALTELRDAALLGADGLTVQIRVYPPH